MRNFVKLMAALAVLAGVVLLVLEIMKNRDEDDKRRSDRALRNLVKKQRDSDSFTIADYRDEDDDEFFADLADSSADAEDEDYPVSFDLSEDALEQLLDN